MNKFPSWQMERPSSGLVKSYTFKQAFTEYGRAVELFVRKAHHEFFRTSKGAAIDPTAVAHMALYLGQVSVENNIRLCIWGIVSFDADGANQSLQLASPDLNLAMKPNRAIKVVPRIHSQLRAVYSKRLISHL